jgi:DNA integrity scanning protein DisA with diadenylate cyclase activity
MNQAEKEAIIDKFLTTKRKGHMLEIALSFKGMDGDAERVKAKNAELSEKVDNLLANIMQDWIDETDSGVVDGLTKVNSKIQDTIRDVKKDIELAKNVVKALGYLDEAIKFASNLLV